MNNNTVIVTESISIKDEEYDLRSVVISELNHNTEGPKNLVLGSSTLIRSKSNGTWNYYYYDPYGPVKIFGEAPITSISYQDLTYIDKSFIYMAQTQGNVFIYVSKNSTDEQKELNL